MPTIGLPILLVAVLFGCVCAAGLLSRVMLRCARQCQFLAGLLRTGMGNDELRGFHSIPLCPSQFLLISKTAAFLPALRGTPATAGAVLTRKRLRAIFLGGDGRCGHRNRDDRQQHSPQQAEGDRPARGCRPNCPSSADHESSRLEQETSVLSDSLPVNYPTRSTNLSPLCDRVMWKIPASGNSDFQTNGMDFTIRFPGRGIPPMARGRERRSSLHVPPRQPAEKRKPDKDQQNRNQIGAGMIRPPGHKNS